MCVDYLASLNLHWFDHVSGIDASLFETQKLKCQNAKAEVFQMLLMNMARDQLTELVGTPREDVRPGEGTFISYSNILILHIPIPVYHTYHYPCIAYTHIVSNIPIPLFFYQQSI